jgi:post-segregation antitoxin (ccd killing protein)
MYKPWQEEIDEACAELAQIEDEIRLEILTNGINTELYERLKDRKAELYDQIAVTVYVDWKFRR